MISTAAGVIDNKEAANGKLRINAALSSYRLCLTSPSTFPHHISQSKTQTLSRRWIPQPSPMRIEPLCQNSESLRRPTKKVENMDPWNWSVLKTTNVNRWRMAAMWNLVEEAVSIRQFQGTYILLLHHRSAGLGLSENCLQSPSKTRLTGDI